MPPKRRGAGRRSTSDPANIHDPIPPQGVPQTQNLPRSGSGSNPPAQNLPRSTSAQFSTGSDQGRARASSGQEGSQSMLGRARGATLSTIGQPSQGQIQSRSSSGQSQPGSRPASGQYTQGHGSRAGSQSFSGPPSQIPQSAPSASLRYPDFSNPNRPRPQAFVGPYPPAVYGPVPAGYIGKPYMCHTTWTPANQQQPIIEKDDVGKVENTKQDTKGGVVGLFVQISLKDRKVWVPVEYVWVNREVYYGELRLDPNHPDIRSIVEQPVNNTVFKQTTQLGRAIEAELQTWYQQADNLDLPKEVVLAISTAANVGRVTNNILKGCKDAGTLQILNKPDFTCNELVSAGQDALNDPRGGIYSDAYADFIDEPEKLPVLRNGSAQIFKARVPNHVERGDPNSDHD